MSPDLEGGCTCGAVRYRLASRPMFVNCCHCTWCQRETGSAFVINAIIERDRLEVTGETEAVATPSESGAGQLIHRCPTCHVALWSHYGGRTRSAFVRAGTLDDARAVAPDAHIFTRSKLPWVVLPADQPAFEIFYELETQWPAESLARRAALA
ncbi:MAG TPA: GFA family protein [Caulobacteraceae bacterium]|jgi:hypothetical protein|nr:GFA family protein [Caulobacteraceae bacterium]